MPDLTICVGIDRKTIEQLKVSWPTWKKHRPEMWTYPWLIFHNGLFHGEAEAMVDVMGLAIESEAGMVGLASTVQVVPWPPPLDGIPEPTYENQRERMLTGWVYVPAMYVQTDWWMKIDTDSLALGATTRMLEPKWFEEDTTSDDGYDGLRSYNCWIASRWFYTKPADAMGKLDDWGDAVPSLRECPRLDLPYEDGMKRLGHPRMASWLSYYHTGWTRSIVTEFLVGTVPPLTLPIPSQDGFHFYVAKRWGSRYHRANMKRREFTNIPNLSKLKVRAAEILK